MANFFYFLILTKKFITKEKDFLVNKLKAKVVHSNADA